MKKKHCHHKHRIRKGTPVRACGKRHSGWEGTVTRVYGKGELRRYDVRFKRSRKGAVVDLPHPSIGFRRDELRPINGL